MRIVIAPDKYKGSLSAAEVAAAMARGIRRSLPAAEIIICPMADGGEGTLESVEQNAGAEPRRAEVAGPLPGQTVTARWAYVPAGAVVEKGQAGELPAGLLRPDEPAAFIEMAQASGFELVPPGRGDPMAATTFGTGQLIAGAMDAGCTQIIVGIGGSATVDGGTGMASALGFRFLDAEGNPLPGGGGSLGRIRSIDAAGRDPRLALTRFLVASDVDNPLTGPDGAARIFGPQKGASVEQVEELEAGLANLGSLLKDRDIDIVDLPGAGAAGGLGAGLVAFCGASIVSGVRLVASLAGLKARMMGADLVITGEGSYDSQTARGKTPAGVAELASEAGVPVVIIAGTLKATDTAAPAFSIIDRPMTLEEAMRDAAGLIESFTANLARVLGRPGGRET
jgi:glycerate kinase